MVGIAREGVNAEIIAEMRRMVGAKNNAELSRILHVPPPLISKINHGNLPVSASLILSLHEETGFGTKEIKARLGLT